MPTGPVDPNRVRSAVVAAPNAATMSAHAEPAPIGAGWSTPAADTTARNTNLTASSRPDMRRNQPRTVPAGSPTSAATPRCPQPAARATNAATTTAAL